MNLTNKTEEQKTKLRNWVQFQIAASVIQRNYRSWRLRRHVRSSIALRCSEPVLIRYHNNNSPSLPESFRNIINGTATFEESMIFWRAAIELRRAHSIHSTDMIIKALLESQGDLARAIILLGSKDFVTKNEKSGIPQKLRNIFLPHISKFAKSAASPEFIYNSSFYNSLKVNEQSFPFIPNTMNSTYYGGITKDIQISPGGLHQTALSYDSGLDARKSGFNAVRSLRNQQPRIRNQYQQKHSELFDIINAVTSETYFSRHHLGSKNNKKGCKSPSKITSANTKSRAILEVDGELNHTLDYLTAKLA